MIFYGICAFLGFVVTVFLLSQWITSASNCFAAWDARRFPDSYDELVFIFGLVGTIAGSVLTMAFVGAMILA